MQTTPQSVLDQLLSQIEMAKARRPVRAAPRTVADPIAQLEQWIGQSAPDVVMRRGGHLPYNWQVILMRAFDSQLDVLPEMIAVTDDPIANLNAWITQEVDAVGGVSSSGRTEVKSNVISNAVHVSSSPQVSSSVNVKAASIPSNAYGELLASLGRRDLPGDVRAEVIAMVAAAIEDPSPMRLREILDRLVHG